MKTLKLITLITLLSIGAQRAMACSMTPKSYSNLQVQALFQVLNPMEIVKKISNRDLNHNPDNVWEVETRNEENGKQILHIYKLEDHGTMCPEFLAVEIK